MVNTFIPKFTYIIPFRYRPDKIIPLRRTIDWLSGFQGVEVLIVEQDKHSKISHLNLRADHIFIESEAPFNKSWAYNVGLRRSHSPVVICGEADVVMNPQHLIEALKELEMADCVIPTSNIVNLNPGESMADLNSVFQIERTGFKFNMSAGITLFKREALIKIGGWNEDYVGLSQENQFQDLKVTKMLNFKQLNFTAYHMHHQNEMPDFNLQQRNSQIWEHYKDGDVNKLQHHINVTLPRIGMKNKFQQV